MNLSTIFGNHNSNYKVNTDAVKEQASVSNDKTMSGQDVKNLQPGQTIQAEVVSVDGSDITIAVNKNTLLQAKMDQDLPVSEGQLLTFEVKSNHANKLALSPLYRNLSQDTNAMKALQAADLPQTPQLVNMVKSLMEEGMPIDKSALHEMNKQMMMHEGVNPSTLAQMNRMQLPITPENIMQFEAYKNFEHQISQSILEIADGLTDTSMQMLQEGDVEGMVSLNKAVLQLFTQDAEGMDAAAMQTIQNAEAESGQIQAPSADNAAAGQVQNLAETLQGEVTEGLKNILTDGEEAAIIGEEATAGKEAAGYAASSRTFNMLELTGKEQKQLVSLLRDAGFSTETLTGIEQKKLDATTLLKLISQELKDSPEAFQNTKLADLFGSKEYGTLLKQEINKQWMLKPEDVAEERNVEELYKRLSEHTEKITNALSQTAKADSPLAGSVNQLSQNVNFMNQLNQMFTYVQIPLNRNGEQSNSELYIYTNKKSLANKEGNISALLHLDMDNLGSVDVHVTLNGQNVATKFYLQDDSTIDFIADNIHILNERIEKRGYSMNCEFIERDNPKSAIEEMMNQDKNIPILSNGAFDARA